MNRTATYKQHHTATHRIVLHSHTTDTQQTCLFYSVSMYMQSDVLMMWKVTLISYNTRQILHNIITNLSRNQTTY